jgi:hypothetical protein
MLRRAILAFAVTLALLVPRAALAQTIGVSSYPFPNRILPDGTNLGTGTRPMNLTPTGISYADCIADQTLQFSLSVSMFMGQDIQIWASRTGMCTNDTERGTPGPADCWPVAPSGWEHAVYQVTALTQTFNVRVQDVVGRQNESFTTGTPQYKPQGPAACATQESYSGTTFNIFFIPITNGSMATGTAYNYSFGVDMVGPPSPAGVSDQAGDTLLVINWTPNNDTNTLGYDIFIDPIPGQEDAGPSMADGAPVNTADAMLVCPDTGGGSPQDVTVADGAEGGSIDGATDASEGGMDSAPPADSGCVYVNHGGGSGGGGGQGACTSSVLSGSLSTIVDAGPITVVDESGTGEGGTDDSGTTTESGTGGIANIPSSYLVGGSGNGTTVTDKSTGTYTISGLIDNVTYNFVVSAVDAFGNVGPPSGERCDYPAPVVDFWQQYRQDGGGAGGFCALDNVGAPVGPSIVGIGMGAAALALARRRRRRGK